MNRYLKSSYAFAIALSMLAAPFALAQLNPGHDNGQDQQHMQPIQQQHMQPQH